MRALSLIHDSVDFCTRITTVNVHRVSIDAVVYQLGSAGDECVWEPGLCARYRSGASGTDVAVARQGAGAKLLVLRLSPCAQARDQDFVPAFCLQKECAYWDSGGYCSGIPMAIEVPSPLTL